jgi:hypothetical protein
MYGPLIMDSLFAASNPVTIKPSVKTGELGIDDLIISGAPQYPTINTARGQLGFGLSFYGNGISQLGRREDRYGELNIHSYWQAIPTLDDNLLPLHGYSKFTITSIAETFETERLRSLSNKNVAFSILLNGIISKNNLIQHLFGQDFFEITSMG